MRFTGILGMIMLLCSGAAQAQTMVALSFDDPNTQPSPTAAWQERNQKILQTLAQHELKAALFVCGMRVDSPQGRALLKSWDQAGHPIANHSYSHPFFSGSKVSAVDFERELLRTDSIIHAYAHFKPWFRFPFLKEGKTADRRDSLRNILAAHGYRNGHVSIDASDWYVDQRLCDSLKKNPSLNPLPYKEYYVAHILNRALYYDSLATAIAGRKVRLVLLLHHNWINALFLDDIIRAMKSTGWVFIDTQYAYQDPIYAQQPDALPAGESLIWSLAKASGNFEGVLRYPAEDGEYEQAGLDSVLRKAARIGK